MTNDNMKVIALSIIAMCMVLQTCNTLGTQRITITNAYEMRTNEVRITNPYDVKSSCTCN